MNPSFQRLMNEATRLTRAGDLGAATAAIQAALGGASAWRPHPAADDADDPARTVDVEARVIDRDSDIDIGRDDVRAARSARDATVPAEARVDPVAPAAVPQPARNPAAPADGAVRDAAPSPDAVVADAAPVPGAGQFVAGAYTDPAGTRAYKLYVPPGHAGRRLPLVVMLHGCTQDPDDFAAGTGMNEAALARGFFVLYPAQPQGVNPSRCWNWFQRDHQRRGQGEPAILAGMTRDVMRRYDIDPGRVAVAGLSAGGAMAAILGDAYPELFVAVGVHSGLPTGSASDVKSAFKAMRRGAPPAARGTPPPTIVFHGDQDATVHPVNGERVVAACAGDSAPERVRQRSGNGREYTRGVYRDAGGRVVAEHWVVHGGGHAWSGGRARGSYTDAHGPDATREMLRFFFERGAH